MVSPSPCVGVLGIKPMACACQVNVPPLNYTLSPKNGYKKILGGGAVQEEKGNDCRLEWCRCVGRCPLSWFYDIDFITLALWMGTVRPSVAKALHSTMWMSW